MVSNHTVHLAQNTCFATPSTLRTPVNKMALQRTPVKKMVLPESRTKPVLGKVNAMQNRWNALATLNLTGFVAPPKDARPTSTERPAEV